MAKFTIESNLVISPKSAATEIHGAIEKAYNSRGSDEPIEEFVNRIVEEFILAIYQQRATAEAGSNASESKRVEILNDASIRKRIDQSASEAPKPRAKSKKKGSG